MLAFTTGCAGSYSLIQPKNITSYTGSQPAGPVDIAYQFDALRLGGGNKRYVKKETRLNYHVVAVRVTNKLDREVNFSRDLNLIYGYRHIIPVPAPIASQDLKQGMAIYLLYSLLGFNVGTKNNPFIPTGNNTFYPIGLFIGGANSWLPTLQTLRCAKNLLRAI